jgi:hypothetical protein
VNGEYLRLQLDFIEFTSDGSEPFLIYRPSPAELPSHQGFFVILQALLIMRTRYVGENGPLQDQYVFLKGRSCVKIPFETIMSYTPIADIPKVRDLRNQLLRDLIVFFLDSCFPTQNIPDPCYLSFGMAPTAVVTGC